MGELNSVLKKIFNMILDFLEKTLRIIKRSLYEKCIRVFLCMPSAGLFRSLSKLNISVIRLYKCPLC